MAAARASLVAGEVDAAHRSGLDAALETWSRVVDEAERGVRTGVPLSTDSLGALLEHAITTAASAAPPGGTATASGAAALATLAALAAPQLELLDAALRPGGHPRSVLLRAVDAARALEVGPLAELVPALLLVAAGLTERLRLLPFAEVESAGRATALAAAADDGGEAFAQLLLSECAESARARRLAARRLLRDIAQDEDRLAPLGRAAITARRALGLLRRDLATTIPTLSVALACSRPAAGQALERLTELALAVEITGRGRDRVFVDALAWRD